MSSILLRFVEAYTGKPIWQTFDMVAGTSTGGLMALALTKPMPLSTRECSDLYLDHGKTIFSRSGWRGVSTANALLGAKYDGIGLKDVLRATYAGTYLESALTPTMVMAYDLGQRLPTVMRSWLPTNAPRSLVDVGLATSAAPTYFPPASVNGSWYVDGGVVANNPSLTAIIEACKLHRAHTKDCLVLSIGTGLCEQPIDAKSALGWGKVGWVTPLIDIMLDGVPDLTHAQVRDLLPDDQYVHIEPTIPASAAALDNTKLSNLSNLMAIGEKALDLQKSALVALLDRF